MDSAKVLKTLLLLSSFFISSAYALNSSFSSSISINSSTTHPLNFTSFCKSTPYPDACLASLKLSISINIPPNILTLLLQTLKAALSEATKLSPLFSNANLVEKQRGTIQDCEELHQITLAALQKSLTRIYPFDHRKLSDTRTFLSAALTNRATCLDGLDSASGPAKSDLVNSLTTTYMQVSNSLSVLSGPSFSNGGGTNRRRRLLGFPGWLPARSRRILQSSSSGDEYDPSEMLIVASDGSGNFSSVSDAVNSASNFSVDRVIIYVREGVYKENVEIPSWKTNIVLIGDGKETTVITGNRSVADGWTTFRSATVAVSGDGFLARDITFENTAGPAKHQAVALRINADLAAVYRCTISGYQDTLYVHSFRQFFRECDIYGTIDYIFGNAAVVLQACNIVSRMPMPGQATVITAQSRDTPDENTGISIQNCTILATDELYYNASKVKSYLGRPWRNYSRTVVLESYLDGFISTGGWTNWVGDQGLESLYYGEYENYGPGSGTDGRVTWPGYHVMEYSDAANFTVSEFIAGPQWLDSTDFPYDDGV